ncbi:DEAD/DEAH box helicase [Bacillus sp. ME78]|uniref:DEAD/DEAH box helicase n=1 Tax=Bacillus sp. ME78 TaxID=2744261 RepID=UPI001600515D|nr:DEAD/DEAH box helicase [Bacillus sp. ME78]
MKPENRSKQLLGVTQSKAKMYEYNVPLGDHINISRDPSRLFPLAIGLLGDVAVQTISESLDEESLSDLRKNLEFSARFFDAYLQSRLEANLNPYLLLLGASSYHLCDLPGSAIVLANNIDIKSLDLECEGIEILLLWLLKGDFSNQIIYSGGSFKRYIEEISRLVVSYFKKGMNNDELLESANALRKNVYASGTSRQLLITDVVCAVIRKRILNSTWYSLPMYSSIDISQWQSTLYKKSFIRELWPAQHLLGKKGVFRGESAVVQMPTSAGKTKATEIIIRSAFLSGRTSLAVIVAPFRALCHEISNGLIKAFQDESITVDELSDVLQPDFEIEAILEGKQVLIVTPEKLLYILRHTPDLANSIGLLIYDEGHQFDNGTRGITYELLLTSLKEMVPKTIQTVLISAVISNAQSVGNWLNGEDNMLVSGTNLIPTYRTIAFTSWLDQLGRLEFVKQNNPDNQEFYVPRVLEEQELELKGREKKRRVFPEKNDGKSIALYLGLKLAINGSVAIFCGTKTSVTSMCEKIVEAYERELDIVKPLVFSDEAEVKRLHFLYQSHLGYKDVTTQSAALGVFTHHGNIPMGIRLSVEHAMKEGLIKFVICTSTLAQGVNLPIRYLIVTSVYQGGERIKTRDFHNLIGRVGRSGMHTEGSIIFADPIVYDKRKLARDSWRWKQIEKMLKPENAEPCASTILSLFEPLESEYGRYHIPMEPLTFVKDYLQDIRIITAFAKHLVLDHGDKAFTTESLNRQIDRKINIISSIESFLMAHWDTLNSEDTEERISELAKGTLAYYLANTSQQQQIIDLFILIANNIKEKVSESSRCRAYGKTLFGVYQSVNIENWVIENIHVLIACENIESLLKVVWPVISENIQNKIFNKCNKPEVLINIAEQWIQGVTFGDLYNYIADNDMRLVSKVQQRQLKIEHVIDICEQAIAYEGTLVLGAIIEIIDFIYQEKHEELTNNLRKLQKRMKYGLSSAKAVAIYELGFADRVVTIELCSIMKETSSFKRALIKEFIRSEVEVRLLLCKYPSYFTGILENILS